ncbi:odorant receptor Or2-like [Tribolium madens]|uniref:odorant receptor Or2-like n=1 Tax=Tribolium madens TaxID=41895 RepID=UPI001CF7550D|nr:odorant receptor Or2-like [Tribolium madens]
MPSIIDISFKVNINVLRVSGLYLPDKFKSLYQVYTYVTYFLLVIPVPILECVNLLVQEQITFRQIADNAFLIAELGCFIPKYWPFVRHGERLKRCIHYFSAPIFKTDKKEHKEILKDCVKVCHYSTAFYFASVTAGFCSWSIRPIYWQNHIFPTDIWLPFDPHTAPKLHVACVYFYLVLAVGYGAYTSAAIDSMVPCLAYQATSQIKILKNNLKYLGEQVDEELASHTPNLDPSIKAKLMYKKIRRCVIHHEHILAFVKEYEECFSQVAFSQFIGGVVVFCVSCLQLTIVDILSFDFLAMMMYLIAMLSEVYLYCHFGTIFYHESDTIRDAIYLGKWYEFDIKSKKALNILMERLKKPLNIRCGKILDMSLVTFTMILRRSYSLLAVLENYNIDLN